VTLAEETLDAVRVGRSRAQLKRLIVDKAYDSDPFRKRLAARGIEVVCPHRNGRVRAPLQDGRKLRRYRKRWKMERVFAWLGNYRRLVVRWDYRIETYRAFFHFACILITLNRF